MDCHLAESLVRSMLLDHERPACRLRGLQRHRVATARIVGAPVERLVASGYGWTKDHLPATVSASQCAGAIGSGGDLRRSARDRAQNAVDRSQDLSTCVGAVWKTEKR